MAENTDTPVRAAWALQDPLLTAYYDAEWGMPMFDDDGVFERLSLEAFQSGLSWLTVLRKRVAFREAFDSFSIEQVSRYSDGDVTRLLADARIIRNERKIIATIANARAALRLREEDGIGLAEFVWSFRPERSPVPARDADVPTLSSESTALARALKRRGFAFVGPTTVYALMTAIGIVDAHVVTSHRRGCSELWSPDGTWAGADLPFQAPVTAPRIPG